MEDLSQAKLQTLKSLENYPVVIEVDALQVLATINSLKAAKTLVVSVPEASERIAQLINIYRKALEESYPELSEAFALLTSFDGDRDEQ